ncbi:MAG: thiamine-phosphate kinase [Gemmatimonadaceae bacterium]|jgi:thiamine-monophosphate kinase|nr:thiamine-phosphate kinase [Gemmatimonadaceae bacterium]
MSAPLFGGGREFAAIARWVRQLGPQGHDIGDDAAVIAVPGDAALVASTDASVEDVHFTRAWMSPEDIGWRATMAALSDLAAMGAEALGVLVALAAPPSWDADLDAVMRGVGEACAAARTRVLGGDTTRGPVLMLTVTVLGRAVRPLRRAGAVPGDLLYVSGALGGPGAALAAWRAGQEPRPVHRARFLRPAARLSLGAWCAAHGATAAIDLSDGMSSDLGHLAVASGVVCDVELAAVPRCDGVDPLAAVASGEEYELLVTAPPGLDRLAQVARVGGLTPIGRVRAPGRGERPGARFLRDGIRVDPPAGHDHLSPP